MWKSMVGGKGVGEEDDSGGKVWRSMGGGEDMGEGDDGGVQE